MTRAQPHRPPGSPDRPAAEPPAAPAAAPGEAPEGSSRGYQFALVVWLAAFAGMLALELGLTLVGLVRRLF
jgi:hypothetical protein